MHDLVKYEIVRRKTEISQVGPSFGNAVELARVGEGQRLQQRRIYDTEDRRRGADAESHRENGNGGPTRSLRQQSQPEPHILFHPVPPEPSPRFVEPLAARGYVAEGAPRGCDRLLLGHATLPEPVRFQADVCVNFCGEIVLLACISHACSGPNTRPIAPANRRHREVSTVNCFRPALVSL